MRTFTPSASAVSAIALMIFAGLWPSPVMGQEAADSSQPAPAVTGTGNAGRIAVWKNSTTLASSVLSQSSGNVGIGTTAPVAKLEVNGSAQVDGNFSLSGSVLLTGAGTLIWAPNDGSLNVSVGLGALPPTTTGPGNTAVGDTVLAANTTGAVNVAFGFHALAENAGGSGNVAIGANTLSSNTEGADNTAVGIQTLYYNTTGQLNTAVGEIALGLNTTGFDNTGCGAATLYANTTGYRNTAVGGGALEDNTIGVFNTADGYFALANNSVGSNNTAIGYNAGLNVTNTSNNIHVGNQGTATDSDTIRIGTVGTQTSAFIAGIQGVNVSGVPVLINSSGQLGTMSSSRRYKEDIHDMGDSSDGLLRLRPVTFTYKKPLDDGSKPIQYGLIAEEVAEVYPDLVARSADGEIETVKYQLLDSMLLNELQKQNTTITAQKVRIETQQQQIQSLEERLAKVEAALSGTTVTAAAR